jgi:flagellar hook-basal body complex protein FliE
MVTPLPPIGAVGGASAPAGVQRPASPGFGDALKNGLQEISGLERQVDAVAQSLATGGPAQIHDLMAASTKSQIGVDLLVQVRNRAVEAYQEIMRMQL